MLGSRRHRECWIVFPGENQIWVTGATGCAAPPGIVHTACGFAEWEMDLNRGTPISDNLRLVKRRSGETETPAWTSRATGRRRWVRSHLPTFPPLAFWCSVSATCSRCWEKFPTFAVSLLSCIHLCAFMCRYSQIPSLFGTFEVLHPC